MADPKPGTYLSVAANQRVKREDEATVPREDYEQLREICDELLEEVAQLDNLPIDDRHVTPGMVNDMADRLRFLDLRHRPAL